MALWLNGLARKLAGQPQLPAPKNGAQFHFSLPGSVQGFLAGGTQGNCPDVAVSGNGNALAIDLVSMAAGRSAYVGTPTFIPPEKIGHTWYEVLATPRVWPGQTVTASISGDDNLNGPVEVAVAIKHYGQDDALVTMVSPQSVTLTAGAQGTISWTLPQLDGNPIAEIGFIMSVSDSSTMGRVLVDSLRWEGEPDVVLKRPHTEGTMWRSAWINATAVFSKNFKESFRIASNRGEGVILTGTRDWKDYRVETSLRLHLGDYGAVILRAQGLRHYYALRLSRAGQVQIVCRKDETERVLAQVTLPIEFEAQIDVKAEVVGNRIVAQVGDLVISAEDDTYRGGMVGMAVFEGALSTDKMIITPAREH
jgi:hypothetical protein